VKAVLLGIAGIFVCIAVVETSATAQDATGWPRPKLLPPVGMTAGVESPGVVQQGPGAPTEGVPLARAKLLGSVLVESGTGVSQSTASQPASQTTSQTAPSQNGAEAPVSGPEKLGLPASTGLITEPRFSWNDSNNTYRFWAELDYLLWWMRGDSLPPLVTTSPPGTPRSQAGVLGAPGTTVLFGGERDNGELRSGGAVTFGYWFNDCQTCGIQFSFFMLASESEQFSGICNGPMILARPFINANTGQPQSQLICFPGLVSGQVNASDTSTGLLGAGAWFRSNLCQNPCGCNPYRLDALIGYRYLRLTDDLSITEDLMSTNPNNPNFVPVGTTLNVNDRFRTQNNFSGLDLGLAGETYRGRWVLGGFVSVALGVNFEEVDINGSTRIAVPGAAPTTSPGGLLALQSNLGQHDRDRFAVVPQIGVNLGYQLTPRVRLQAGYSFLYWSEVVRPGYQIDQRVNTNLLPPVVTPVTGPLQPAANIQGTPFWAQGFNFGVQVRF
jgi:hypothetical protein